MRGVIGCARAVRSVRRPRPARHRPPSLERRPGLLEPRSTTSRSVACDCSRRAQPGGPRRPVGQPALSRAADDSAYRTNPRLPGLREALSTGLTVRMRCTATAASSARWSRAVSHRRPRAPGRRSAPWKTPWLSTYRSARGARLDRLPERPASRSGGGEGKAAAGSPRHGRRRIAVTTWRAEPPPPPRCVACRGWRAAGRASTWTVPSAPSTSGDLEVLTGGGTSSGWSDSTVGARRRNPRGGCTRVVEQARPARSRRRRRNAPGGRRGRCRTSAPRRPGRSAVAAPACARRREERVHLVRGPAGVRRGVRTR
jgi:hypothetical protein